jgi:phage/plasmid-like protein (TIGR03299 family)
MPANVGEMFYTGEVPWHGLGVALSQPATLNEALKVGGLDWQVGEVDLLTADEPPSPVERRKALVRSDRLPGDKRGVVGVVHQGFRPIQNREAGLIFDAIFGQQRRVYHTGGYLGNGEVVWLLARIDRTLRIAGDDIVQPYALMANSHDGSMAFNIRLTTVRVVCQNTLTLAMTQRISNGFRRAHQGSFSEHAEAAHSFFGATLRELDFIADSFTFLAQRRCSDEKLRAILAALIPEPPRPRNAERNPGLRRVWENQIEAARIARATIMELSANGKGTELPGSRGTFWGALNAVLEYVDHHRKVDQPRIAYTLLGDGMELKMRAFHRMRYEAGSAPIVQEHARASVVLDRH